MRRQKLDKSVRNLALESMGLAVGVGAIEAMAGHPEGALGVFPATALAIGGIYGAEQLSNPKTIKRMENLFKMKKRKKVNYPW